MITKDQIALLALKIAATRFELAAIDPAREAPFMSFYAEEIRLIIKHLSARPK